MTKPIADLTAEEWQERYIRRLSAHEPINGICNVCGVKPPCPFVLNAVAAAKGVQFGDGTVQEEASADTGAAEPGPVEGPLPDDYAPA